MASVTAIILTKNEEKNLAECLQEKQETHVGFGAAELGDHADGHEAFAGSRSDIGEKDTEQGKTVNPVAAEHSKSLP